MNRSPKHPFGQLPVSRLPSGQSPGTSDAPVHGGYAHPGGMLDAVVDWGLYTDGVRQPPQAFEAACRAGFIIPTTMIAPSTRSSSCSWRTTRLQKPRPRP